MKEQIKELRVKIDGLAQLTKGLKPETKFYFNPAEIEHEGRVYFKDISKEIEKSVDSLYLAKAWLGKLLGELGNENPYGSGYKTKEDIVPTQDVSSVKEMLKEGTAFIQEKHKPINWETANHIEKVDWLREEIETIVFWVKNIPTQDLGRDFAIARTNCYTHLCEARFWLGFEMERIKNS